MNKKINNIALIVAGGSGARLGAEIPKQYIEITGKSILQRTIEAFQSHPEIDLIQVVIAKEHQEFLKQGFLKTLSENNKLLPVTFGGENRQESVRFGLEAIKKYNPKNVLIHDSVRPFVSHNLLSEIIKKLESQGFKCAIPALKITDSVKEINENIIKRSLPRENLVTVQTPQGFDFELIYDLHNKFQGKNCTDDSALAELAQQNIAIVEGEKSNYKITTIEDLKMAEMELNKSKQYRVGSGFDVHQFEEGDGVILCGIKIPFNKKLKGHSDADCAWHALTDAILGAIGEGDIGEHFPDTDPQWKGANSEKFLSHANNLLKSKGGELINVDITIICEKPKMKDFKTAMRENTARVLNLNPERVNIKATTTEKLGFLGREEGLASTANVSVLI